MNNIFTPDKSNFLLKGYHISSKLLIPIFITSLMTYKSENDNYKILHTCNVLNIGFHSYVSSSCIISDYIKPKHLSRGSRFLNLGLHGLGMYGYLENIYKK
tara:strand:- start:2478 stop:2780 length:303 start_codon:yes stop_codon:yes gene_type:complete